MGHACLEQWVHTIQVPETTPVSLGTEHERQKTGYNFEEDCNFLQKQNKL